MKRYLLLTSVVLVSAAVGGAYAAVDCSTPPSCSELGYDMTASECGSAAKLKCPFGDGYYCAPKKEESGEADDSPVESSCGNGMIIYDNRKCYNGFPTDRVPMGIIVDATTSLAAFLTASLGGGDQRSISWGRAGKDSGLGNCSHNDYFNIGDEGVGCTEHTNVTKSCEKLGYCNSHHPWLTTQTSSSDPYAVVNPITRCYGTVNFADIDVNTFLPSAGEVFNMVRLKYKFNQAIADIKEHYNVPAEELNSDYYWTSNEADANNALAVNGNTGQIETKSKEKDYEHRCFFYYDKELSSSDFLKMCNFDSCSS